MARKTRKPSTPITITIEIEIEIDPTILSFNPFLPIPLDLLTLSKFSFQFLVSPCNRPRSLGFPS